MYKIIIYRWGGNMDGKKWLGINGLLLPNSLAIS
jgi:hypothetical protein